MKKLCTNTSGRHTWRQWLSPKSIFRAFNVMLNGDPALRVCGHCGQRGRVDNMGRVAIDHSQAGAA